MWCESKALGYRYGGHAFKPCHRTSYIININIRCVLLVNQPMYVESTFVAVSLFMYEIKCI